MNHKVLLADDSLTIQKVIKITLAQQPYDITDASSEEELFRKLADLQPKLVFLDFNLSEKFTGYELTSKIKSIVPSTKVLLLLGTFDSVDDAAMDKCGASDKIVKPFDSNKFISVCRHLIDSFVSDDDLAYPEPAVKEEAPLISNPEDQWQVSNPAPISSPATIQAKEDKPLDSSFPQINALEQGLSEWSMSVPGVISQLGSADKKVDLPPVIESTKPAAQPGMSPAPMVAKAETVSADMKLPTNDDLEYPDFGIEQHTPEDLPSSAPAVASKKPSYVSLDEFAPIELSNEDATGEFVIDHTFNAEDSNVKEIEDQIADEVEEDLWHVDEFEELKKEVSAKMEEVKNNFQPTRNDFDDSLFGDSQNQDAIKWNESSNIFSANQKPVVTADMRSEMEEMVKKYVQEYMDQMFQKSVEKVSWEIIPDLAENLIRQELGKISSKILSEK